MTLQPIITTYQILTSKTKLLSINRRKCPFLPDIVMNHKALPESEYFQLLGLPLRSSLSWGQYIEDIAKAASKKIGSLHRAKASSHLKVSYIYTNQQFALVLSIAVIFGQVNQILS